MTPGARLLAVMMVTAMFVRSASAAPQAWSPTVEGIHARLVVVSTTDDKKRPQLEVWLEVENVSDTDGGIPLPWGYVGDMLVLVLEDEAGKAIEPSGIGGSHASGPPYIVALPVGATLRVPVSKNAIEYVSATKTMFRPLTFQAWDLPAKHGKLFLRGTLSPHAPDKGQPKPGSRAWKTAIEIPRTRIP